MQTYLLPKGSPARKLLEDVPVEIESELVVEVFNKNLLHYKVRPLFSNIVILVPINAIDERKIKEFRE